MPKLIFSNTYFYKASLSFAMALILSSCGGTKSRQDSTASESNAADSNAQESWQKPSRFFAGADLSYVNEMIDCGAQYRMNGELKDPYVLFAEAGTDIARVRLWHNPSWTQYSNLSDVKRTIRNAKNAGMKVLLDFHYSDTWADPEKQFIPAAWESMHSDTEALSNALYEYTYAVLNELLSENIVPEFVQVGNETNSEILQIEAQMTTESINWRRNAQLLNSGLKAVTDFSEASGKTIERVLHVAQPENALWWFEDASAAGLRDFDIIGLSYYGKWSVYKLDSIETAIRELKTTHNKDVLVVETAYPWTMEAFDQASNILGEDSLLSGYRATPDGQLQYLKDLSTAVAKGGGIGVIYWEPAWVSTSCSTLWGTGSHWENASFFDAANQNNALPAMEFFEFSKSLSE